MTRSSAVLKAGTRTSKLARIQTQGILARLGAILPDMRFEEVPMSSPGDRDRETDLKASPPDFFTRDIDQAVLDGKLDCAIHSAKDMPDPVPAGLDWFWFLPWREDPRDVLVLPEGKTMGALPANPRIGVSSERREGWCRKRFPKAQLCTIRGTIEERLAQLDKGSYDLLVMAAAALARLGLQNRISEWIPVDELAPPDGQGVLAMAFRAGDESFLRLRSLFVKSVAFVGAGTGTAGSCTVAGVNVLERCDVCIHDSLMDRSLLNRLPGAALRIDAGKRCGEHSMPQDEISRLITVYARRGLKVVRLKGGDPGIFGRLAEEVEALDNLHIPYSVIPGVSSLNTATGTTGMLLTRRGVSRGFCVMTPRQQGGGIGSVGKDERSKLPVVFFMAASIVEQTARQLLDDGMAGKTPAAMVFNAGGADETVIRGTLAGIAGQLPARGSSDSPGLLIVGEVARYSFTHWGALEGCRVLLTCSDDLQDNAAAIVTDLGGIPLQMPLIKLTPAEEASACVARAGSYDWIVLTSPSAVRCFIEVLGRTGLDTRTLPKIVVCGPGTARELRKHHIVPDAAPASDFGAGGLTELAGSLFRKGDKVLRLRSEKAGTDLSDFFRKSGLQAEDCILYRNEPISYDSLPQFDAVFFASSSAVDVFVSQWGKDALKSKTVAAIGKPTEKTLSEHGINADVVGREATVPSAIAALAEKKLKESLEKIL